MNIIQLFNYWTDLVFESIFKFILSQIQLISTFMSKFIYDEFNQFTKLDIRNRLNRSDK